MARFIAIGDYAGELKDTSFRNDFKVLAIFDAEDMEKAKISLREECGISDINTIENRQITIFQVVPESENKVIY